MVHNPPDEESTALMTPSSPLMVCKSNDLATSPIVSIASWNSIKKPNGRVLKMAEYILSKINPQKIRPDELIIVTYEEFSKILGRGDRIEEFADVVGEILNLCSRRNDGGWQNSFDVQYQNRAQDPYIVAFKPTPEIFPHISTLNINSTQYRPRKTMLRTANNMLLFNKGTHYWLAHQKKEAERNKNA